MNFSVQNQSPWLIDYYNKYLPQTGFLVEVGVGHIISPNYSLGMNFTEIGCGSNSYDLIQSGWSALLIDPILEYCKEAELVYSGLKNVNINCVGVSDKEEDLTFFMEDTFIPNSVPIRQDLPYIGRKCKLVPLSKLLEDNFIPKNFDLLSIDVEGFELKVLSTFNIDEYSPKLIIVETNVTPASEVIKLIGKNYTLAQSDHINSIFLRRDLA
jgi:FkbM family methyltransferase